MKSKQILVQSSPSYHVAVETDASVSIHRDGREVGAGRWAGGCIVDRTEKLDAAVYDAIERAIAPALAA